MKSKRINKHIKLFANQKEKSADIDKKHLEFERQLINLEYSFERGVDFINRVIQITDDIDYPLFDMVDVAMTQMESESPRKTITFKINSFGGSLNEALAVYGRIKESKCHIVTKGYGAIMSAASLLFASGHSRQISHAAWGMIHEPSFDPGYDRMSTQEARVKQMKAEWGKYSELMAASTHHLDAKYWYGLGKHLDAYFSPEKMVEVNLATEII
jgi:ATP-dependent protease ClpP protease subunit